MGMYHNHSIRFYSRDVWPVAFSRVGVYLILETIPENDTSQSLFNSLPFIKQLTSQLATVFY